MIHGKTLFMIFSIIFIGSGCNLISDEDTDLCSKYKRPATINQAWRLKMDVYRSTPYPLEDHKLMFSDSFEADVTVRLMNCERVEADYRQIHYTAFPKYLVPLGATVFTFDIGPAQVFSTTNESDYLSVQYSLFTYFTSDAKAYISDTLWFDYSSWTTAMPGDTFNVWITVPSLWYESKKRDECLRIERADDFTVKQNSSMTLSGTF